MLFLVVLLGVSFYQNKRPLEVLRTWFGVQKNIAVQENAPLLDTSEQEKKADTEEQIKQMIESEATSDAKMQPTTSNSTSTSASSSSTLTAEDKAAIKNVVDGLIVK